MKVNTRHSVYLLIILVVALYAMHEWRLYLDREYSQDEDGLPVYTQCEKVYVGKTPFACQPGDLIFIDAEVADKYCTDKVFSRTEDSVYCIYNGIRDDRERKAPLFKRRIEN
jgi:hypothetical protein